MPADRQKQPAITGDLLLTKLVPPALATPPMPRPGLLARLDDGIARRLTLIVAPAGFGKTTLAASWLADRRHPAAWLSLDAGDNDPVRFWRYVLTACRAVDPTLGKSTLAALRTLHEPSFTAALTPWLNELACRSGKIFLVLEDYHLIAAPLIQETLAFCLEHLPATLHPILISRHEPPLPLARWRARNELSELGAADLRFSDAEIRTFLEQTLPIAPPPELIAALAEQTEGWAAGLRLATLTLQNRPPQPITPPITAAAGQDRHVLDYLVAEVLSVQSESTQDFLLRTGFLPRLTGTLCDAVTGRNDGARMLDQLERSSLFLTRLSHEAERIWYRYHPLFAETLRHAARQRLGENEVLALHEKAGGWYEAHGRLNEAVEAALASRRFENAALLIEQLDKSQGLDELHTLRRWTEGLPPAVLHAHPDLSFHAAFALLLTSDRRAPATAARMEPLLQAAEREWQTLGSAGGLGRLQSLRAAVAWWQGDLPRAAACARRALELLPETDADWRSTALLLIGADELWAGRVNAAQPLLIESLTLSGIVQNFHTRMAATQLLGETCVRQGEFASAGQYYQQVLAETTGKEEMLDDQGYSWCGLGTIALERNELETAEQQAVRALGLGRQCADERLQVQAALLLACVQQARGQFARAREQLQTLAARTRNPGYLQELRLGQIRLALIERDPAVIEREALISQIVAAPRNELEALIAARLHLAQERIAVALELLDRGWAEARTQGRLDSEIEILCLQALAHAAQSDPDRALPSLSRALTLAHPAGFRYRFLKEGPPMADLLRALLPRLTRRRSLAVYAVSLLRDFTPGATPAPQSGPPALIEPLSPQEQRVLRWLAAGLSNPEIARELVVSINTVKTQVQSIYRKLNVNSREEAREAAHELHLL